jgi:hypothetical protein
LLDVNTDGDVESSAKAKKHSGGLGVEVRCAKAVWIIVLGIGDIFGIQEIQDGSPEIQAEFLQPPGIACIEIHQGIIGYLP